MIIMGAKFLQSLQITSYMNVAYLLEIKADLDKSNIEDRTTQQSDRHQYQTYNTKPGR